jgi:hypothetical protein
MSDLPRSIGEVLADTNTPRLPRGSTSNCGTPYPLRAFSFQGLNHLICAIKSRQTLGPAKAEIRSGTIIYQGFNHETLPDRQAGLKPAIVIPRRE